MTQRSTKNGVTRVRIRAALRAGKCDFFDLQVPEVNCWPARIVDVGYAMPGFGEAKVEIGAL